jgi:hypothetical protein
MLLGNELFAGGGVKSGVLMKNKIMIEPNKAAQRRVHLAYARAFVSLERICRRRLGHVIMPFRSGRDGITGRGTIVGSGGGAARCHGGRAAAAR